MLTIYYYIIFFKLLTIKSITATIIAEGCQDDWSSDFNVKWPATTKCTISQPPCLQDNYEFAYRCCKNNQWAKQPSCYKLQNAIKYCPDNFIYDTSSDLCYILTDPMEFPPDCPYPDTVPFNKYKSLLDFIIDTPIWMPVQRDLSNNGLGLLRWIDTSFSYGSEFRDNYQINGTILGKNCLINQKGSLILVDCKEQNRAICAYPRFNQPRNNLCRFNDSVCYQSNYQTTSECVCLTINNENLTKIEFLESYQNWLYPMFNTSDTCAIGLEKNAYDQYIWLQSMKSINYTNWSTTTQFGKDYRYGAITKDGWILTKHPVPCVLFIRNLEIKQPYLQLKQINNHTLELNITNHQMLKWLNIESDLFLYCFTDTEALTLVDSCDFLSIRQFSDNSAIYWIDIDNQAPGSYWCESLQYPELKVIKSNKLFIREAIGVDTEFTGIFRVQYENDTNPLYGTNLEIIPRILFIQLGKDEDFKEQYIIRLMKVLRIDETQHYLYVNIHFTGKKKETETNLTAEYDRIKTLIEQSLNGTQLHLVSLKNSDYCLAEITDNLGVRLTWPNTPIGQIAYPKENCLKNNYQKISRQCTGDFIDGGEWMKLDSICQFDHISNITQELAELIGNEPKVIINKTLPITENCEDFEPFDLVLISELFREIRADNSINLGDFLQIVSNLHRIRDDVLHTAQDNMNATDLILDNIDNIIFNNQQTVVETEIVVETENVKLVVSHLHQTKISGVLLEHINNTRRLSILYNPTTLNELTTNENLESAILFDNQFVNQFVNGTKISITVFLGDSLFNQRSLNFSFISTIFGVQLPQKTTFDSPIITLNRVPINYRDRKDCVFWRYGSDRGYWQKDHNGIAANHTKFMICEYNHITHFALLLIDDIDDLHNYDLYQILDIITDINCILSILGLCGILLTGVLFKSWRLNTGNQILMNFAVAITIQIVLLYISNAIYQRTMNDIVCTIIGVLLHYSLISEFCWMFIIAILQFKRFVQVLTSPPKNILLKACICGWLLPLLPVACVILLDPKNYLKGHVGLCYPSGLGLYLGVSLPITIIVVINSVIFIYIIYNVVHKRTDCVIGNTYDNNDVLFQWRLGVLLFFMLGITWMFGLLVELDFGIVFVYLFCLTSSLQGFIMFLFFIVFNENTKALYYHLIKLLFCMQRNY